MPRNSGSSVASDPPLTALPTKLGMACNAGLPPTKPASLLQHPPPKPALAATPYLQETLSLASRG